MQFHVEVSDSKLRSKILNPNNRNSYFHNILVKLVSDLFSSSNRNSWCLMFRLMQVETLWARPLLHLLLSAPPWPRLPLWLQVSSPLLLLQFPNYCIHQSSLSPVSPLLFSLFVSWRHTTACHSSNQPPAWVCAALFLARPGCRAATPIGGHVTWTDPQLHPAG